MKHYYYDDADIVDKLGSGVYYSQLYFGEGVEIKELDNNAVDAPIEQWNDQDQYQLYYEALQ